MKLKERQNIFHVVVSVNSIVQHVIQNKNEIIKHVNMNVKIILNAKNLIVGIHTCIFGNSKYLKTVTDTLVT